MIKFLVKTAISLVLLFVVVIVPYNYFYGNPEEKERSSQIIGQAKDLASSVFQLLSHEKEQYQSGKYDGAVSDLKQALGMIHQKANSLMSDNPQFLQDITNLEDRELKLEEVLTQLQSIPENSEAHSQTLQQLGNLFSQLNLDTQRLADQVNQYESQLGQ